MFLQQLLLLNESTESPEIVELRALIKSKCQPYLRQVANAKNKVLYRGMRGDHSKLYHTFTVRTDRKPVDSSAALHDALDSALAREFGAKARSAGVFVIGDNNVISEYGEDYMIFPVGDFNCIWSPHIADAYTQLNYYPSIPATSKIIDVLAQHLADIDIISEPNPRLAKRWLAASDEDDYYQVLGAFLEDYVGELYEEGNLPAAIESGHEIMLVNLGEYIAVNIKQFFSKYYTENFVTALNDFIESCISSSVSEAEGDDDDDFIETNAPKTDGRFRDLSPEKLAKWLLRTRNNNARRVYGSIQQQIRFNKSDKAYVVKMERTREIVKKLTSSKRDADK